MRIGFHGLLIHPSRFGGAETYARKLLDALQNLDDDNEYFVFVPKDSDLELRAPNFHRVDCIVPARSPYARVLWEQSWLRRVLRKERLGVVHFPGSTFPWGYGKPCITTIHDTLRYQFPGGTPRVWGAYCDFVQKKVASMRHDIIAVSHADAAVMAYHLGIDRTLIHVTHLGVDEDLFLPHRGEVGGVEKEAYILWAGHPYKHKNIEVLLDAVKLLKRRSKHCRLRLVGIADKERARLMVLADQRNIGDVVSFERPVAHRELGALYRRALLFCFPSWCESFGLPALEAMASRTAVVCSDLPAFREVYGDCAEYFPPESADALASVIEKLLDDPAQRGRLEEAGARHAAKFTWKRCAEETLAVYRSVYARGVDQ